MICGASVSDAATFLRIAIWSWRWTFAAQRFMFFVNENRYCHVVS
jgi:hypothetical protein